MNVHINLTNEEKSCAQAYADTHGLSLTAAFKQALFGRIKEELGTDIDANNCDDDGEGEDCESIPITEYCDRKHL